MHLGARLVIPGTLLGSALLAIFLYLVTAGSSFPQTALAAVPSTTTPPPAEILQATPLPEQQAQVGAEAQAESSSASNTGENAECVVSAGFPESVRQWCSLIMENAQKHGLPADLIAALIWQESGGDQVAYSKSGAVGLMQVMPRDGKAASFMCVNGPCFTNRPSIAELEDPEFNVRYGTKMLASLVQRYGNYRDALKNYGPRDVGYYYADIVMNLYEQYGN